MSEKTDLEEIAAAIDRLSEQQQARNLLALATLRHRRINGPWVEEAESIITGTPSESILSDTATE
jgi:hypothetical protein